MRDYVNVCVYIPISLHIRGYFFYHLKSNCSQMFCQVGDPGQVECLCSWMLSVCIYEASRNPVVLLNNLRCTGSLQMAWYSQNVRKVQMLHTGMLQFHYSMDLLPLFCEWPSRLWRPSLFFSPSYCSFVLIKTQTIKYTKMHCAHPAENRAKRPETC